ncbi:MAG: CoA ester lyase [Alphaproteobacteria bacterium]|nr:CoA ester lyase [Alphaproteobacteria bacterium]
MATPLRTLLFAPGNHPRKVERVFGAGADAVILDLEDAVALAEKVSTRPTVVEALRRPRSCLGYVRVNAFETPYCYGDMLAAIGPWLNGIVLPKTESAAQLQAIDWLMTNLERERGLSVGSLDLLPIVETALGVHRLDDIAASRTRVRRLSFGAGDFTRDMNLLWTGDELELNFARSRFVLASRVAGIEPPIDSVFIDLKDSVHLERSAHTGLSMGFQGKLCIHPDQVEPVNRVYTPTPAQVAEAKRQIAAFAEAEAKGSASIQVDGYFVDYPIVEKAKRIVALVEGIAERDRRRQLVPSRL